MSGMGGAFLAKTLFVSLSGFSICVGVKETDIRKTIALRFLNDVI